MANHQDHHFGDGEPFTIGLEEELFLVDPADGHLVNTGADGMQEVQHLHVHVMGGPRPWAKG